MMEKGTFPQRTVAETSRYRLRYSRLFFALFCPIRPPAINHER